MLPCISTIPYRVSFILFTSVLPPESEREKENIRREQQIISLPTTQCFFSSHLKSHNYVRVFFFTLHFTGVYIYVSHLKQKPDRSSLREFRLTIPTCSE